MLQPKLVFVPSPHEFLATMCASSEIQKQIGDVVHPGSRHIFRSVLCLLASWRASSLSFSKVLPQFGCGQANRCVTTGNGCSASDSLSDSKIASSSSCSVPVLSVLLFPL